MANKQSAAARRAREERKAAMYLRMQQDIDRSRGQLWMQYFGEAAEVTPNRGVQEFINKFDDAWRRSMLPNTERDDMTPSGNYHATGRDINGYVQPA